MIKVNTLSARIALATLSSVAIGIIILGIIFYYTFDHMEHKLLEMLDSYAIQNLNESDAAKITEANEQTLLKGNSYFKFSSSDNIPDVFRRLEKGFHHDIQFNDRRYHVAVKYLGSEKKYIVFDITDVESQEHILNTVIIIATTSVFFVALWVTYWLSRKVILPVRTLADQVGNIEPNTRNIRIADQYNDVEVGSIARSFDRYMERLDGFVEREQAFASTASHELRTPLSIISTSVELLENSPQLPSQLKQYTDRIKRSTDEMTDLISALLFLARENMPSPADFHVLTEMTPLLQELLNTYKYVEKDKAITLSLSIDNTLDVNAPQSHVKIVINNLLSNAIRYTKHGQIDIRLHDNQLQIKDTGCGIDDDILAHIFKPGVHGQNNLGHGFGLYLCKRICIRYGWDIALTRNQNHGTTATVSF